MIGNYENWAFAQPGRDWGLVSYKSLYGNLDILMEMGLVTSRRGDLPHQWGPVYKWFFLGLKQSESRRLATPPLLHKENCTLYLLKIREILRSRRE